LLICIWEIQTKGVAPRVCGEEGCLLVLRDFPFQFETTSRFFFLSLSEQLVHIIQRSNSL
jgi:hypothetical protein